MPAEEKSPIGSETINPRTGRRATLIVLAAATFCALLLADLFRPAGGLLGRYAVRAPDGTEIVVHERVDARLDFPVPGKIDAAYRDHWRIERHGFPGTNPPYHIHWRGLLLIPESGAYRFALESSGEATLLIDGTPLDLRADTLTERPLSAGAHPIEVDYLLARGEARIVLRWQTPGSSLQAIPSGSLAVDQAALGAAQAHSTRGWIVLALGLGAALAAWVLFRIRPPRGRALRFLTSIDWSLLTLGLIVLLAAFLRFHDYTLVPLDFETEDEYQHAWEGWSLLHEGAPRSWSFMAPSYPEAQITRFRWLDHDFNLVRPYFDHPPLFSVLVGLVSSLAGPPTEVAPYGFLSCRLYAMRLVPVLLSLFGIVLLRRLARVYGASERAALLGALVYAVLPVIVASHRLVKSESLLTILFMAALLSAHRHAETGERKQAWLAGLLCGLSLWAKMTGVAVVLTVVILLMWRKRRSAALIVIGVAAVFVLLYMLYGAAYDWDTFLMVVKGQAREKWAGFETYLDLLRGKVVDRQFGGGAYLWLGLCAITAGFRRVRALLLPLAVYVTVIALLVDCRAVYGWYRIPLYPFLCVAAGAYLEEMLEEADLYRVFPFAITAVVSGALYALPASFTASKIATGLFALVALAPYLLRLAVERPSTVRIARLATALLFAAFLISSLAVVGDFLGVYSAARDFR